MLCNNGRHAAYTGTGESASARARRRRGAGGRRRQGPSCRGSPPVPRRCLRGTVVTFSGKWRGLFSASWHGQVVLGMARSVGPAIEYLACHLNTQDWGVPVHVVEGVAAVLTLPLHG